MRRNESRHLISRFVEATLVSVKRYHVTLEEVGGMPQSRNQQRQWLARMKKAASWPGSLSSKQQTKAPNGPISKQAKSNDEKP